MFLPAEHEHNATPPSGPVGTQRNLEHPEKYQMHKY